MLIAKDEQRYLIVVSHDGKEVYRTDAKDYDMLIWSDKKDILLKSEFALRLNPEHQSDAETDYRAMIGLSWAF